MANYDNQPRYGAAVGRGAVYVVDEGLRAHMLRVYNYMTIGLGITGLVLRHVFAFGQQYADRVRDRLGPVPDQSRRRRCSAAR